jgi:hypothetical protein
VKIEPVKVMRSSFPHLLLNVADIWREKPVCNALKLCSFKSKERFGKMHLLRHGLAHIIRVTSMIVHSL